MIENIFLLGIAFLLPIGAFIDLLNEPFPKASKIVWALIITFIPLFGPVAYLSYSRYIFFFGKAAKLNN